MSESLAESLLDTAAKPDLGAPFGAVTALLSDYFDGIYFSDTSILRRVFHPGALYACATDGTLLQLGMADYFAVVDQRPAPGKLGQPRQDRIVSIEFAGPGLAIARVECAIFPKRFVDLLTLVHLDGRWQIMSKVFHFEIADNAAPEKVA
ncbi:nuclear transport factor 2 family protein [Massilia sp. TWP1-3-3]|uniref:nuclear transport factor 2 family protein n=1 Tax=Massilia sp. TWP1-3-3 TaxID=2804573 RepID=UPI003CEF67E1